MIGIIVSGHGNFATGITSSIELIVGKQEHYIAIDFPLGTSLTKLEEDLNHACVQLADCDDILICCDLFHGTPFNQAMLLAIKNEKIKILYGINVGMMIEMLMNREQAKDFDFLCETAVQTGKEQIGLFSSSDISLDEEEDTW
ncbi:MAG: PTS galactosamine/N-acetylgalactosamine transporter subunit IIA [Erysipelotrichaceae bacterium]